MMFVINHSFETVVVDPQTRVGVSDGEVDEEIVVEVCCFLIECELSQLCVLDLEFDGVVSEHSPDDE